MQLSVCKKILACILALALAVPVFLAGCTANSTQLAAPTLRGASAVTSDLREKYEAEETVEYIEGIEVARDHQFTISIGFDAKGLELEAFSEIAALYYDADLTQKVFSHYAWASEELDSYIISPPEGANRYTYSSNSKDYPYGFEEGAVDFQRLFKRDPHTDWGNTGTMYLATWLDLDTGEKLEKPTVQTVTVKGELDTPKLSLEVDDRGVVRFSWSEITDAKAYYIAKLRCNTEKVRADNTREIESGTLIDQTTSTTWDSEPEPDSTSGRTLFMNYDFETYSLSEDDWLSPVILEDYSDKHNPEDGAVVSDSKGYYYFCVIAVNETGSSMYSNLIDIQDIASLAPNKPASYMNDLSVDGEFYTTEGGILNMPSHQWIVMCDGSLSQKLMNYDFEKAWEDVIPSYYIAPFDGEPEWWTEAYDVVAVPYTVEGTAFTSYMKVKDYDKDKWKDQLKIIEARQESLRNKTGDVNREVVTEGEGETRQKSDVREAELAVDGVAVTANSALSEYLALNMLSTVEEVDLSEYPEASNQEYLVDAWSEAFYQNPLVLGVSEAMISRDGKTLFLTYEDGKEDRERKQEEITNKVDKVASEIFESSMTDREKEFAINEYLCETVEYDNAALENAAEYDYMSVDSEYYDSFTAYGALIDGVGVCSSYAASFKLLADAAGLSCVVVTGYLDGTLGHAWNRVDLGSGKWATIDSTNNDMDIMPNALLNAPDSAIASTLVEDTLWLMDSSLTEFNNDDDTDEYYHVEGLFFDKDAVVDELVSQLKTGDTGIVRTDYALSETQFSEIGNAVLEKTGNKELSGCYWLGIIVITSDYSLLN